MHTSVQSRIRKSYCVFIQINRSVRFEFRNGYRVRILLHCSKLIVLNSPNPCSFTGSAVLNKTYILEFRKFRKLFIAIRSSQKQIIIIIIIEININICTKVRIEFQDVAVILIVIFKGIGIQRYPGVYTYPIFPKYIKKIKRIVIIVHLSINPVFNRMICPKV